MTVTLEFDSGVRAVALASGWGSASDGRFWTMSNAPSSKTSTTQLQFYTFATNFGYIGSSNSLNCTVMARISVGVFGDACGIMVRYTDPNNHLRINVSSGNILRLRKIVAGVTTDIATASVTMSANTEYWFKLNVTGTTYNGKFWQDGTTEPLSWLVTGTATDPILASGFWGCFAVPTTSTPVSFDTFSVSSVDHVPVSNQDTAIFKFQLVKVFDTNGNFLDVVRDAPYVSFKDNINASSDAMRILLPRRVDAFDGLYQSGSKNTIVLGNIVQVWVYGAGITASGLLKYAGIIDTITPKIDEQGGETVEILVTPRNSVLGDAGITSVVTFGTAGSSSTYVDTGVIFQSFFSGRYVDSTGTTQSTVDADTGLPYGSPYTMDPSSVATTGQKTQFAFQNQNLLSALTNVLLLGPANYYYRMQPNQTTYFGQVPITPTYTLLLGQHITSIEFPQDNVPRKNVIIVRGKGVSGKYTGSSVSTIGARKYYKADNRITDASTAQALANGLGATYDQTVVRAKVKIPDYRGDALSGLGFDIEQFQIGQTVLIKDGRAPIQSITGPGSVWGSFVWGRDKWGSGSVAPTIWGSFTWGSALWGANVGSIFNQVLTICSVSYNFWYVELEIGTRAPSLNRKIYELQALLQDATLVS